MCASDCIKRAFLGCQVENDSEILVVGSVTMLGSPKCTSAQFNRAQERGLAKGTKSFARGARLCLCVECLTQHRYSQPGSPQSLGWFGRWFCSGSISAASGRGEMPGTWTRGCICRVLRRSSRGWRSRTSTSSRRFRSPCRRCEVEPNSPSGWLDCGLVSVYVLNSRRWPS